MRAKPSGIGPVRRPLDPGCGFGVLALAKTWRVPARATDRDPDAVRVASADAAPKGVCPLMRHAPDTALPRAWLDRRPVGAIGDLRFV